jgi:hypothetical protein
MVNLYVGITDFDWLKLLVGAAKPKLADQLAERGLRDAPTTWSGTSGAGISRSRLP